jgi:hypothetical protein
MPQTQTAPRYLEAVHDTRRNMVTTAFVRDGHDAGRGGTREINRSRTIGKSFLKQSFKIALTGFKHLRNVNFCCL